MIRLLLLLTFCFWFCCESRSQDKTLSSVKRYVKVPAGYLMVLRRNDSVLGQLANFARAEKIPSANFTGMGFVDITFGFFDFETKKYQPRDFKHVELVSMHGTIAWKKIQHPSMRTVSLPIRPSRLLAVIFSTQLLEQVLWRS